MRIRESDQFKTLLELYELEIHQKKSKPDYHKLRTMVKRSIDEKLRSRNLVARNGRIETGAVVKNRRVKVASREDRENAGSGKRKDSGSMETTVVE